jgi:hypothetical protein
MVPSPPSTALGLIAFCPDSLRMLASLTCQTLGLSNRRHLSREAARLALRITTRHVLHMRTRLGASSG